MGKAAREQQRRMAARDRIAAQRAAERRSEMIFKVLIPVAAAIVVVAIVAAFVVVKLFNKPSSSSALPTGTALSKIVSSVTSVPASTLESVGKGAVTSMPAKISTAPALTLSGKPEMVYIGALYCPFCAAERWGMAVALSRFGTFSNLSLSHSSSTDAFPNTSTLSFYKSTYSSPYLTFTPVETTTTDAQTPLQQPTAAQQALLNQFDAPPYVAANSKGAIPFIDIGNKYVVSGSSYSPQALQGKTWSVIASSLSNPSNPIAKSVDGTANVLTAAICKITSGQPATVCDSPAITALKGGL